MCAVCLVGAGGCGGIENSEVSCQKIADTSRFVIVQTLAIPVTRVQQHVS